jgi:hypothetical protein
MSSGVGDDAGSVIPTKSIKNSAVGKISMPCDLISENAAAVLVQ